MEKEIKQKISLTLKRKYSSGEIINPFLNKKHTEESKEKNRQAHLGKEVWRWNPPGPHTEEHKKKISQSLKKSWINRKIKIPSDFDASLGLGTLQKKYPKISRATLYRWKRG